MKIAYILNYPLSKVDGVVSKVVDQKQAWTAAGNRVELVDISGSRIASVDAVKIRVDNGLAAIFFINVALLRYLRQYSPDLVYLRACFPTVSLVLIGLLFPLVIEINSDDSQELRLARLQSSRLSSTLLYWLNLLARPLLLGIARKCIFVTNELMRARRFLGSHTKSVVIPNGIDLSQKLIRKRSSPVGRPRLFFIGSPEQEWQGFDVVRDLASGLSEFDFDIVGTPGQDTANLTYHGYLSRSDYEPILMRSHICLGTLALHRKRMTEACPLKVREYLARGFPTVLGYDDTAFLGAVALPTWLLRVDTQNDLPSTLNRIRQFVLLNMSVVVERSQVEDAIGSLSLESRRVQVFNQARGAML